jgi:hypothetical protein
MESGQQQQQQQYGWRRTGLTWASEYQKYGTTGYQLGQIVPPPNWQSRFPQGQYTEQYPPPDLGKQMERLKVWMSVAALPDFRKLWGKNDDQDLAAGRYRVTIDLSKITRDRDRKNDSLFLLVIDFNTVGYGGKKWLVLSTLSPLGGRNFYLALTYMAVGSLCLLLATTFSLIHCLKPR